MNEILNKIIEDINKIKVIDVKEEKIDTNTNFIAIKRGSYLLNNGHTIIREGLTKKEGSGETVCIFATTADKKILIVIQPRASLETKTKVNIELPAGYLEKGENIEEAGARELTEETGYTSNNIIILDTYYPALGCSGEKMNLLLALDCYKISEQKLDSDEFVYYEEVTIEEFEYLLNNGYIKDANARIGYYRYLEYLMKEGS